MPDTQTQALRAREKAEIAPPAEQMRPGPTFTPAVDIFETESEIYLVADIPGVKARDLNIDLRESVLTLTGDVESPEDKDEVAVFKEYQTGRYLRKFTLSQQIDQSKIEAELKNGVLRLRLPKIETAVPRKISVRVA